MMTASQTHPHNTRSQAFPALWRLLTQASVSLLFLFTATLSADELTERCLEHGSAQADNQSDSQRAEAIDSCSAAVAAHPNSDTLNAQLVRLLIRDDRALAAVPYLESLLEDEYTAETADLIHETCAQLAEAALREQSIETLFASDGSRAPDQATATLCNLSADLELFDQTLGAQARYWGGLAALTRTEADRGLSMIGEAAMIGHPMAGEIAAYLCDVIDVDDPAMSVSQVAVLGNGGADLLNVAAASCEAAMTQPPADRSVGEFVEPFALLLLRYDLSADAAQLLANAALSLSAPYNEQAKQILLNLCDTFALHPSDPQAGERGVADHAVVGAHAADFCAAALQVQPDDPRLTFQYGRGLLALGDSEQATGAFAWSLDQGYAPAAEYLNSRGFQAADFASPELVQVLYDGNDAGMRAIEQQYQTVMHASAGLDTTASPYVFRFLSALVVEFGNLQTYPCGRSYLDGSEKANLEYRVQRDQMRLMEETFKDPWGTIGSILEQTGIAGDIQNAGRTGDMGSVLTSIGKTEMEVKHLYEGAANTGTATAKLLAIDYECGPVAKRIIENITDYAAGRPMRHRTEG